MKKEFLPYYVSRAILSTVVAILFLGFNWKAAILAVVFFGFFLLYLHSGWFTVDSNNPFTPLRRDTHAQLIQRKALIIALLAGLATYFALSLSSQFNALSISGNVAVAAAVIAYFATQFVLFIRS